MAQASTLSFRFEALQSFVSCADDGVTGVVDALRSLSTITGTITFDLTILGSFPGETFYAPPVVSVDGVDLALANARAQGLVVRGATDVMASATTGFVPGVPEPFAEQVSFVASSSDKAFIGPDNLFPTSLAPRPAGAVYSLTFFTTSWNGSVFTATESATYRIGEIAPVPLPAPALLLSGALVGLMAWRRSRAA